MPTKQIVVKLLCAVLAIVVILVVIRYASPQNWEYVVWADLASASVTLLIGLMGAFVSLKPPKEHQQLWFVGFVFFGFVVAMMSIKNTAENRSAENKRDAQMRDERAEISAKLQASDRKLTEIQILLANQSMDPKDLIGAIARIFSTAFQQSSKDGVLRSANRTDSAEVLPHSMTFHFMSSPEITPPRKQLMQKSINEFVTYLQSLGFPHSPKETPFIGPGERAETLPQREAALGSPEYLQKLLFPARQMDSRDSIVRGYSHHLFTTSLQPMPGGTEVGFGIWRSACGKILGQYFGDSFLGARDATSSDSYGFAGALFEIRTRHGSDRTDQLLIQTYRLIHDSQNVPPIDLVNQPRSIRQHFVANLFRAFGSVTTREDFEYYRPSVGAILWKHKIPSAPFVPHVQSNNR